MRRAKFKNLLGGSGASKVNLKVEFNWADDREEIEEPKKCLQLANVPLKDKGHGNQLGCSTPELNLAPFFGLC